jgi:putative membrane protein
VSQASTTPSTITVGRSRWLRRLALAAVVLVPLAFAGLFVGAVGQISTGIKDIPAAIVNNDKLVYQTDASGKKNPILAGRQLVTELTGKNSPGFSWTITNTADAKKALADGTVYAIITVPADFSKSVISLSSPNPVQAKLQISTDDSHNYLTGSVAQVVGDGMVATFGKAITQQYIAGIYSGLSGVGDSLSTAADGAGTLADGTDGLASGLGKLSTGLAQSQSGASQLSSGVSKYTGGVDQLATGLKKYSAGATAADKNLSPAVTAYTGGVAYLSGLLTTAADTAAADPTSDNLARVQSLAGQLSDAAAGGSALSSATSSALGGLASGSRTIASGASKLSSGSAPIRSGTSGLASGLGQLASGVSQSASGARKLATGAHDLSSGLASGAKQVPSYSAAQTTAAAKVAASPIGLTVSRANEVSNVGQIIATLFVPLGLWIGSLAVFLVLRPASRRILSSTAAGSRLVLNAFARASIVTGAQALLLVGLLHIVLGVSWSLLPATILFSLVMALAFTAFHYLLTIGLGRAGLVVSLFLLAIQITSTGGLYPIQLLATPFQVVSPFLPLTYGVAGMQAIMANSGAAAATGAAIALLVFGALSLVVALLAIRRVRRAGALGLVQAPA